MKLNFDLKLIEKITHLDSDNFDNKINYFCSLPLNAKILIFHQMKIIEEDDEYAFFQQNFDQYKIGEYRFSLFLLAIERVEGFINNSEKSKYLKIKSDIINGS